MTPGSEAGKLIFLFLYGPLAATTVILTLRRIATLIAFAKLKLLQYALPHCVPVCQQALKANKLALGATPIIPCWCELFEAIMPAMAVP